MSRRRLNAEEVDLWRKVAETTERLHPKRTVAEIPSALHKPKPKPKKTPRARLPEFQLGSKAALTKARNDLLPSIDAQLTATPVQMDKKSFGRMKRGKLLPEAKLDLHGMTMDKAHPALIGFLLRAHSQSKRLVLVITGKGKHRDDGGPIPVRYGVLKHNVPQWLRMMPLSPVVLQVTEAHLSHGGSGAYYIYLRRNR